MSLKNLKGGSVDKATRPSPSVSASLLSIGSKKIGNDGNQWKVSEDINGRHMWIMARNKTYNLERSKSKTNSKSKSMSRTRVSITRPKKSKSKSKSKTKTISKTAKKSKSKSKSKNKSKGDSKQTIKMSRTKSGSKDSSKTRKGPSQSATLYKLGTKKIGNDGNRWEIAQSANGIKRWKLYKKI